MVAGLKKIPEIIAKKIECHPGLIAAGIIAFIVLAGLLLFCYLIISGLAGPVQAVYAGF